MSGVYTWPSGNCFEGQWMQGKRHGLGIEVKGHWVYKGEWTQGFKGRYGARQSSSSGAKYEGTWTTGLQDGYGVETYADGGSYQGQWLRGMRHGYGVRQSVPYGLAAHYRPKQGLRASLTSLRSEQEEERVVKDRDRKIDESRGGFVLKARSDESPTQRRRSIFDKHGRTSLRKTLMQGLKLKKQKSTGDIQESPRRPTGSVRSTTSNISHTSGDSSQSGVTNASMYTDSNLSFVSQDDITDTNVTETYMGEWKNDKRSGFGISERSDGLKYEGEWFNNKKYGYGITTLKDGGKEEGKYKNNLLISSGKKSKLFLLRSSKLRERVDNAVGAAQRAAQIALQKADIAISRMANARAKSEQAEQTANKARQDSDMARVKAKEYAPDFLQPGNSTYVTGNKPTMAGEEELEPHHHPQLSTTPGDFSTNNHRDYSDTNHRGPGMSGDDSMLPNSKPPPLSRNYNHSLRPQRFSELLNSNVISDHFDQYGTLRDDSGLGRELDTPHEDRYYLPTDESPVSRMTPQHPQNQQLHQQQQHQQQQAPHLPQSQHQQAPYLPHQQQQQLQQPVHVQHSQSHPIHPQQQQPVQQLPPHSHPQPHHHTMPSPASTTPYPPPGPATTTDRSPDSGVSDSDEIYSRTRPLQRRKTLPSIVKHGASYKAPSSSPAKAKGPLGEVVHSQHNISTDETDTYVIENGIRKRIRAEVYAHPPSLPPSASTETLSDKPKELPKRYKLEAPKLNKRDKRGSLPDVTVCKELGKSVMPREEVSRLSEKRRQEMQKLREEEERRKQQEIVLRLTDVKDWCQQRQLLMLVIALNVSLATMFFNLLSQ